MRSLLVVGLARLLVAAPLSAQFIQGQVIAAGDRRILPDVRVVLYDDRDSLIAASRSDSAAGAFFFEALPRRTYQIAIFDRLGNPYKSPAFRIDSGAVVERRLALPDLPARYDSLPLAAIHVELRDPANPALPVYPDAMRLARRSGTVRIAFIVDALGEIEPGSVYVASSTHPLFTGAVLKALPRLRFVPVAELARPKRVLDQRTFSFTTVTDRAAGVPCVDICIPDAGPSRRP